MRILAIDPGITTGYCLATTYGRNDTEMIIEITPKQNVDDVDDIWRQLEDLEPRYIICEDFEFRQKARTGLNLFPMQAIGVVRLYEQMASHQCAAVLQKAATGKAYYTNKQLKDLGVYKPGAAWEHSMDATRHLLHWLTFGSGYQFIQGKRIEDLVKLV